MLQLKPTPDCPINNRYIENRFLTKHHIHEFHEVREEEVLELLTKSPAKSCELDPFPSKLLLRHCLEVAPILTQIVNASLTQGEFTSDLKNTLLHPLLKKAGIDCIFKNYRPVSNLSFLSKLIERAVCKQITQYTGKYTEKFQSAYRASHSTETALIKVKDDILRAIDNQRVTCLILLNLSAAFNALSHPLLLNRLQHHFGMQGIVLKWFENYMLDHNQKVALENSSNKEVTSNHSILEQGVPHGSALGPILFTLYTSPLGDICGEHDVLFQSYADDQQIYLSFSPDQSRGKEKCLESLERCISDIHLWIRTNLLKLNDEKTELIVLGTRQQLSKVGDVTIMIGTDTILAVRSV